MPHVPVDPILDKELSHRPSVGLVTALPLRNSPEPVNCTAVFDALKPLPQRPFLPGVREHPSLRNLKGKPATMTDTDREMLRTTFGQDAELYDQCRPSYPPPLFVDLATLAGLGPHARVLEIGCGTGQATLPLAHLGCTVVAMDLSPDMAAIARRNVAQFPNVTVVAAAFEDWLPSDGPFDAILSATAFHWLDPEVRMIKTADLLRPGGFLGIVSTHHIAGGTNARHAPDDR
jgi:SAM-dependent methyltransferase